MRRGGKILVILGIVLALIAGAGVYVVLATAEPGTAPVQTTKLVIAVQPIDQRTEIQPEQLAQADWPVTIPTPIGAYAQPTEVAGKFAMVPINPGQPLIDKMVKSKAELKDTGGNASLLIDKGMVAIALPVSMNTNVAQAIEVGDHVDILATFTAQPVAGSQNAGPPQTATQRLLPDVLIIQVGPWPSTCGKGECNSSVVTFQLKEQDALVLKYALEKSEGLTLVLRPSNDHQLDTLEPVTMEYINKRFGFKFPTQGQ
jgi:Flp pilus assembly protein CpaB